MKNTSVTQNLIEIKKFATQVFNSQDMANQWLTRYNHIIGDTPLSLLNTGNDSNEIKKMLATIAYGGVV